MTQPRRGLEEAASGLHGVPGGRVSSGTGPEQACHFGNENGPRIATPPLFLTPWHEGKDSVGSVHSGNEMF